MGNRAEKKLIVFVCKGNIHRSAIAEQVFRNILETKGLSAKFEVTSRGIQGSAGTKPTAHKNITKYEEWKVAKPSLDEFKIDITHHEARSITEDVANRAAIIFAFDKVILEDDKAALMRQFPRFREKIHLLSELEGKVEDIQDCHGINDSELYRNVTERIHGILTNHWKELIAWVS